jgi:hypothetical protein
MQISSHAQNTEKAELDFNPSKVYKKVHSKSILADLNTKTKYIKKDFSKLIRML